MAFCTNCGARLPEGAKFCTSCGAPVRRAVSTPQGGIVIDAPAGASVTISDEAPARDSDMSAPAQTGTFVASSWTVPKPKPKPQAQSRQAASASDPAPVKKKKKKKNFFGWLILLLFIAALVYYVIIPFPKGYFGL